MNGNRLVKLARDSINSYFSSDDSLPEEYTKIKDMRGVFVTLTIDDELRGCIGYPEPVFPLGAAVWKLARSAAFEDPRFPPVLEKELEFITIEVSVLTVPKKIRAKPKDLPKKIKIGKDGLIIKHPYGSGLLLPQVAKEYKWKQIEFLENLCMKANLPRDTWKSEDAEILHFQAEIFHEKH